MLVDKILIRIFIQGLIFFFGRCGLNEMIIGVICEVLCIIVIFLFIKKLYNYVNYIFMQKFCKQKYFVILKLKEKVNNVFIKLLIDNFKLNLKNFCYVKFDLINYCFLKKKKESFCLIIKFILIIFQIECFCKIILILYEEMLNEVYFY